MCANQEPAPARPRTSDRSRPKCALAVLGRPSPGDFLDAAIGRQPGIGLLARERDQPLDVIESAARE